MESTNKEIKPMPVSEVELAFGGRPELLPVWDSIPSEFKDHFGTRWNRLFNQWFYKGLPAGVRWIPKPGIDVRAALNHIQAVMCSWDPKHEHKEAAVAFLLSLWFEDVKGL